MNRRIDIVSEDDLVVSMTTTAIAEQLARGAVQVGYSGGKDSSALLNLTVAAAAERVKQGFDAVVHVLHVDTGVENPEVVALARGELRRAQRFAKDHGIDLRLRIIEPAIWDTWPVRVIGGRGLPTFPDTRRDCTSELKLAGLKVAQNDIARAARARGEAPPVILTGVRREESVVRAAGIDARSETSRTTWTDDEGRTRMSPLRDWTGDDVWTYLGRASAGQVAAYSDFSEVMRVYRDAGGSSCAVVGDMRLSASAKPCSARFGCFVCTAVREDHSMAQIIDTDPERYGYMRPLAELRDFIAATQYDWSRRNFIGRTINDGTITIAADVYSPSMLRELLRYTLTAQAESGVQIISERQILAIDARWSLFAIAPPYTALRIWREWQAGARWPTPKVKPFAKTAVPRYGRIHVGEEWDSNDGALAANGLRHPVAEAVATECGVSLRTTSAGRVVLDLGAADEADVDEEGAAMFMDFEADERIARADRAEARGMTGYWTSAYIDYLSYGVLQVTGRGQASADAVLRRSQWRQRCGLHGEPALADLLARLTDRAGMQGDMFEAELVGHHSASVAAAAPEWVVVAQDDSQELVGE